MLLRLDTLNRPLRHFPPDSIVEFTTRTVQSRLLLRPSESLNEIVIGVVGRALEEFPGVKLHAIAVLSNHIQGIASAKDGASLAGFMGFLKGNIARKVGRIVNWREKFWGRRYRSIPILDAESQVGRLKYILSQGVQEGLVPRPELWPGVHCARALMTGEPLRGTWFNQTDAYFARRAGDEPGPRDFATAYEITLAPLPCWEELSQEERQNAARVLVEEIVQENDIPGRSWLGVEKILAQDPHGFPNHTDHSPAPICHAATQERWKRYKDFYRELVHVYEGISRLFRKGLAKLEDLPAHCFPPPLPWRSTGPCYLFAVSESPATLA